MKQTTEEILTKQWIEAPTAVPSPQPERIPYHTGLEDDTPDKRAKEWLNQDWTYHIGGKEPTPKMIARARRVELKQQRYEAWKQNGRDDYIDHFTGTIHGLKLMELVNGRLFSTYTPPFGAPMEYYIGQTYHEQVHHNHGGGYYLYLTRNVQHFMSAFWGNYILNLDVVRSGEFALVECEASGPYIFYDATGQMITINQTGKAKKVAATRLTIGQIVYTFAR